MAPKPTKRRRSYAWALAFSRRDPEYAFLSAQSRTGLECARLLAENARERSRAAIEGDLIPERLPLLELAQRERVSISELSFWIEYAKEELFGRKLGQRAIYYRLEKRRQGEAGTALPPPCCAEEGCRELLPHNASAHKRFCARHATPAARVRRHRRRLRVRAAGSG